VRYDEWEKKVPDEIREDVLWKVEVYRLGLFAAEIGWYDVSKLAQDRRTLALSNQLYRALGSISANIAEGYSRSSGKDRARFYEYALGSARESRDWYYKSKPILKETVIKHRLQFLTQIIRLLLTMIPQQRRATIREDDQVYQIQANVSATEEQTFLIDIPLPDP